MYRNRKYRSGTSTLLRGNASSSLSSQQKNDAATTVATATSDQSNSISRILTEQVNIIPEEEEGDGSPMSKILVNFLFFFLFYLQTIARYKLCFLMAS